MRKLVVAAVAVLDLHHLARLATPELPSTKSSVALAASRWKRR
jgi:hypothetical protein